MTPVTDPEVLKQLNGGALKPVTDPAILAQLNGAPAKQGGLLRNLGAGLAETIGGGMAQFSDPGAGEELGALGMSPKVPMGTPAQGQHAVNQAFGALGINPETTEPQTGMEQLARTGGQLAPAAIGGPGGIISRMARVAVPTVTSTMGREIAKGTPYEEPAAFTGALAGGGLTMGGEMAAQRGGAMARSMFPAGGNVSPETRAGDFVRDIASRSGADVNNLPAASKPLTAAEALGPQAQTHLMALARREGATGSTLTPSMYERAASRPQRVMDDMAQSAGIHPEAAKGNIDALVSAGQAKAKPLFDAALGGSEPVNNQILTRLAQRPAVQKAMALAATDLRNADINPVSWGLELDPMMGETGAKQLQPTAQAWDLVRKNLAGTVERDAFGKPIPDSISRGNHNINQATRDLTAALKEAIPGYGKALDVSGDYLSARSAFEQGQASILNPNVSEQQFADQVKRLTPANVEALKGGIANKIFEQSQNARLSPKQFLTPRAQAKLSIALGPDKAKAFIANLQQEAQMKAFEGRAVTAAGSQTAPLSQAMKEQDTFGQSQAAQDFQNSIAAGGLSPKATAMHWVNTQLGRGGQKAADYLRTSGLSPEARDIAGRLLMMHPNDLAAALKGANLSPSSLNNVRVSRSGLPFGMPSLSAAALAKLLQHPPNESR